jgi:hypothetical protein
MIVSQRVSKEVKRVQWFPTAGIRGPSKGLAVGLTGDDDRGVVQTFDPDSTVIKNTDVLGVWETHETSSALVRRNFEQCGQGKCFPGTFQPRNEA